MSLVTILSDTKNNSMLRLGPLDITLRGRVAFFLPRYIQKILSVPRKPRAESQMKPVKPLVILKPPDRPPREKTEALPALHNQT